MENKLALIPISEIKEMAVAAYKSGLFQLPSQEATLTLMLLCQAEGLHPIQALRQYHIIKGRPAMRADAMQAAFTNAGGKIEWRERSDKKASAVFSHPQGGSLEVTWTIEQATAAGLTGNPTWQKFPRAMLSARVVSEGCRAVLPAVVCGLYTPEEVSDFDTDVEKPTKSASGRAPKAQVQAPVQTPVVTDAEIIPPPTAKPQEKPQTLAEKCGFNGGQAEKPEFSPEKPPVSEEKAAENQPKSVKAFWCDSCYRVTNDYSRPGTCKCGSNVWYEAANMEAAQAAISKKLWAKKAEATPEPEPKAEEPKPNTMPAAQVAQEIKQVRALAQQFGCKTQQDFAELMQTITGEKISSATQLTDNTQRAAVINWLTTAVSEEQKEAA